MCMCIPPLTPLNNNIMCGNFVICCRIYVAVKVVVRVVFVVLNNVYCIPTYCVWMLMLLPLRKLYPPLYWKMEGLFFHWLLAMVTMWSWTAGYDRKCTLYKKRFIFSKEDLGDINNLSSTCSNDVLPYVDKGENFRDWMIKL